MMNRTSYDFGSDAKRKGCLVKLICLIFFTVTQSMCTNYTSSVYLWKLEVLKKKPPSH